MNTTLRYLGVAIIASLLTAFIILFWLKINPDFFLQRRGEAESASLFYPNEAVVIDTVKKANPAVVAITISKYVPVYERYFERLPGFFGFSVPAIRQRGTELQEVGGGSGFLVSSDGYIVTNYHVVNDRSAEYTVFLNDGRKFSGEVVLENADLDIAIMKIDARDLPFLPFGDSSRLQVGQSVIAIGNALAEFRNTVSVGIISGLSRSIVASDRSGRNEEELEELIQTDAAINPGNSGGPLLNLSGEVVGVNVAVASGAENIGFAVSGNSVKAIVDSLR